MTAIPDMVQATATSTLSRLRAWELIGLLWIAYFLNQADRQIFGVTLPSIRAEFGLSDQQMGLVATTFTIVFAILVPLAGLAGDRFQRRNVVAFSLVVFSAGTLLTGTASGLIMLLLFRGIATGAGEAFYSPSANALIAEHHSKTRARALSIHQTANYTGVVFGSLLAGWVADIYGWRHAFLLFGTCGLLWAGILLWRAPGGTRPSAKSETSAVPAGSLSEALRLLVSEPLLLGQAIGFSALVFVLVGYLTWMPTILYERFGLSLASAGFSAVAYHHALAYIGLLVASDVTDRMARRFARARVFSMAVSLILCAPFIWLSADAEELWVVYAALGGFGLFRGIYDANLFAAIFDYVEDRLRSTVTGLVVAIAYFVGAISPLLMGTMKQHYGIASSLHLLAVVAACAGILFLLCIVRPKARRLAP